MKQQNLAVNIYSLRGRSRVTQNTVTAVSREQKTRIQPFITAAVLESCKACAYCCEQLQTGIAKTKAQVKKYHAARNSLIGLLYGTEVQSKRTDPNRLSPFYGLFRSAGRSKVLFDNADPANSVKTIL